MQSRHCSPSKYPPGNSRVGEGGVADGEVWRVALGKENKSHLFSLSHCGFYAGVAGAFGVSPLFLSPPQHHSWRCISSSSRWLQLLWWHLLLLFHLPALAGTAGKKILQGLSTPSSITICQTCKKKKNLFQCRGSAGTAGCDPWGLFDPRICFRLTPLMGSETGDWKGGIRVCTHFTHPIFRSKDPSDRQIKRFHCKEQ